MPTVTTTSWTSPGPCGCCGPTHICDTFCPEGLPGALFLTINRETGGRTMCGLTSASFALTLSAGAWTGVIAVSGTCRLEASLVPATGEQCAYAEVRQVRVSDGLRTQWWSVYWRNLPVDGQSIACDPVEWSQTGIPTEALLGVVDFSSTFEMVITA